MAEPSTPEIPKETTVFPITKESADRTLSEIAEDPDRVLVEEGAILAMSNPDLNFLVGVGVRANQAVEPIYIEGALWTHRILRQQAEARGTRLPRINRDLANAYLADRVEELKHQIELSPDSRTGDIAIRHFQELVKEEPELGTALNELFKYRAGKPHLYGGVVNVYIPISNAIKGRQLGKSLGL